MNCFDDISRTGQIPYRTGPRYISCRFINELNLIDRAAERYIQYAYGDPLPTVKRDLDRTSLDQKILSAKADARRMDMSVDELLLMPAELYGFSLGDRKWRELMSC